MFHRYARRRGRKRPGSSLVEMLIALVILVVMLFSIMAVMTLSAQSTIAAKEGSVAYLTSLSELERLEALQVSGDVSMVVPSDLGNYKLNRDIIAGALHSADIRIRAAWDGAMRRNDITIERQVSPSAWQNAGQQP